MRPSLGIVAKAPETLLFESASVAIGRFRCSTDHPLFEDSGPSNAYCFVFPRSHVWIVPAGAAPFVAHPGVVTYYNEGQRYARRPSSAAGDDADWFAVAPDILEELLASVAPHAIGRGRQLFRHRRGPSPPSAYLRQRRLVESLQRGDPYDPLTLEEAVLTLLAEVVAEPGVGHSMPPRRRHVDLVEQAKALLAGTAGRVQLRDLARRLSASPFHLCRSFSRIEGRTLSAHHRDVRLRAALTRVMDGGADLTQVAYDDGFSSHSHFTSAFRAHFGLTPSAVGRRRVS
jgi:AraC-like DNA-binding protein